MAPDLSGAGSRWNEGQLRLRIVDASVFPRIPGYFLACAVYMIAEKAADVLLSPPQGEMA